MKSSNLPLKEGGSNEKKIIKVTTVLIGSFALLSLPFSLVAASGFGKTYSGVERFFKFFDFFSFFFLITMCVVSALGFICLFLLLVAGSLSKISSCIAGFLAETTVAFLFNGPSDIGEMFCRPGIYSMMIQGWFSGWVFWKIWEWAWRPGKAPTSLGWFKRRQQV